MCSDGCRDSNKSTQKGNLGRCSRYLCINKSITSVLWFLWMCHTNCWSISCSLLLDWEKSWCFCFLDRLIPTASPEPRPPGPLGSDNCMLLAVCFCFEAKALYPSVQDRPPNSRKPTHQSGHRSCRSLQAGGWRVSVLNDTFLLDPSYSFTCLNLGVRCLQLGTKKVRKKGLGLHVFPCRQINLHWHSCFKLCSGLDCKY